MRSPYLLSIVGLLIASGLAEARPVRLWQYDKLLKESDVVVIANAIETKAVPITDNLSKNALLDLPEAFQQMETVFLVRAVVKGNLDLKQVTLVHFRYNPDSKTVIGNGPLLIEFPKEDPIRTIGKEKRPIYGPDYLLFLKVREDGRFVPVTGQVDPVFSVRALGDPMELTFPRPSKQKESQSQGPTSPARLGCCTGGRGTGE